MIAVVLALAGSFTLGLAWSAWAYEARMRKLAIYAEDLAHHAGILESAGKVAIEVEHHADTGMPLDPPKPRTIAAVPAQPSMPPGIAARATVAAASILDRLRQERGEAPRLTAAWEWDGHHSTDAVTLIDNTDTRALTVRSIEEYLRDRAETDRVPISLTNPRKV